MAVVAVNQRGIGVGTRPLLPPNRTCVSQGIQGTRAGFARQAGCAAHGGGTVEQRAALGRQYHGQEIKIQGAADPVGADGTGDSVDSGLSGSDPFLPTPSTVNSVCLIRGRHRRNNEPAPVTSASKLETMSKRSIVGELINFRRLVYGPRYYTQIPPDKPAGFMYTRRSKICLKLGRRIGYIDGVRQFPERQRASMAGWAGADSVIPPAMEPASTNRP